MFRKSRKATMVFLFAAAAVVSFAWVRGRTAESADGGALQSGAFITVTPDRPLEIEAASVTENASFIPVEVDGTKMEIIAVRDSRGAIRTAFNTCQVCFGSSQAYYKQSGNSLVCQNCGNRFSMDRVGVQAGGCNPWPISDGGKTVTEDKVVIPYDYLVKAREIFSNWKVDY